MDKAAVWRHILEQRVALAAVLTTLTDEQWEHDSLCAGWTVRDVAAHLISTPQIGLLDTLRMMPAMTLGYNRAIFRDVKRRGRAPVATILEAYDTFAGSRHHVPVTTHVEPLLDVLVHTQDIVRPLGLRHDMPVDAAAVAADRARMLSALMGSRRVVRCVRMVATDTDWARGRGPVVEGPVQELLMLCAGRPAELPALSGDGLGLLPQALRPRGPTKGTSPTAPDRRTDW